MAIGSTHFGTKRAQESKKGGIFEGQGVFWGILNRPKFRWQPRAVCTHFRKLFSYEDESIWELVPSFRFLTRGSYDESQAGIYTD